MSKETCRKSAAFSRSEPRETIDGFEAMLWLKKGFAFTGERILRKQNELLACCVELKLDYER